MGFFIPITYAKIYENFDSRIQDFSWDYHYIDRNIKFSVDIFNILDKANYIVHLDVIPDNNKPYHRQTELLNLETGWSRPATLVYPIKTIDSLDVKTWVNPPLSSANPKHKFDEARLSITADEMWQKIKDKIPGTPLLYDVIVDDDFNLNITIKGLSSETEDKGIRILYSGNSEICNTFGLKFENSTKGSFSGHSFYDQIFDLSRHQTPPDFRIICHTDNTEISVSPDLQDIFKDDLVLSQINCEQVLVCNFQIPDFLPPPDESFPLQAFLVVIAAIISLIAILIKKTNWISSRSRHPFRPNTN